MMNGMYKVSFKTPIGQGCGVVILADGSVQGGDSGMAYRGQYKIDGSHFDANIHAFRHTSAPGVHSVFGVDDIHISLSGEISDVGGSMIGSAKEAPNVKFTATFSRI